MSDCELSNTIVVSIITALITAVVVWITVYGVIASECRKLGGFYVGTTVFVCSVKEGSK